MLKTTLGETFKEFVSGNLVTGKTKELKRFFSFLSTLFILLLSFNIIGIIPYFPPLTSHVFFALIISVMIYVTVTFCSVTYRFKDFFLHFCPLGTPGVLTPFLILIELISMLIRPLTLAVRVAANITTGHILLSLIGSFFSFELSSFWLFLVSVFYTTFEFFVCAVQAYIFSMLRGLFLDEHP